MLKKTVTYNNPFTDEKVTEDLYFNLTTAELAEVETLLPNGLDRTISKIAGGGAEPKFIMDFFRLLVKKSYGDRVGSNFIKTEEKVSTFMASEAYSTFFLDIISDPERAAGFIAGIVPKDVEKKLQDFKNKAEETGMGLEEHRKRQHEGILSQPDEPATPEEPKVITRQELLTLPQAVIQQRVAEGWVIEAEPTS